MWRITKKNPTSSIFAGHFGVDSLAKPPFGVTSVKVEEEFAIFKHKLVALNTSKVKFVI